MNSVLDAAHEYAAAGRKVFPCRDKRPLTPHGLYDATTDPEQIKAWWEQWPNAQLAMPTGKNMGAFVLDIDQPEGPATLASLEAENGMLPATKTARTGSGGEHRYFCLPDGTDVKNSAGKLGISLDVRGNGGYVIVPPTPGYAWTAGNAPFANAPQWLLDRLLPPAKTFTPTIAQNSPTTPTDAQRWKQNAER